MAVFGIPPKYPDGTEGYASITLTLKEPDSEIKTIACIINNDGLLQELQRENRSDLYVKTHKDTKFFLYFYCSESNLSDRLVKSEVVAHRFTKPNNDKNCIIENKWETRPFSFRDNHVFLPACHDAFKTVEFEEFLTKYSKAVTLIENLSAGKYRGVQNSNVPVKYLSFSLSSSNNTLSIPNPAYMVFQNLVDGPLLLFEEASKTWKLIGWYKNTPEKNRIIVYNLIAQGTTDIWFISISNQTDGSQHPPDPSVSADPLTSTDQSDQSVLTGSPTSTSQANQSVLTGPPTSTDQENQSGLTGPPTSTDQANQSGLTGPPTSTDHANQSGLTGPPTSTDQANQSGLTGPPTSTDHANQSGLTGPTTSTDQANQSGLTGPTTSTDQANQSGLTGPTTSTDQANQSGLTGPPTSTDQANQSGLTGPTTSTDQPNQSGSTGLPTSTNSQPNPNYQVTDFEKTINIAVSSRALFNLEEEHGVFKEQGLKNYNELQLQREDQILDPGAAFPFIKALQNVNAKLKEQDPNEKEIFTIALMSHNNAQVGIRLQNSIEHHGLIISQTALNDGESAVNYLKAYNIALFLTSHESEATDAIRKGFPAAVMSPQPMNTFSETQLRIAFGLNAVLISEDSDRIYQAEGLGPFLEHEIENKDTPLKEGTFKPFAEAIGRMQKKFDRSSKESCPISTYIVTSRHPDVKQRVLLTLRSWGLEIDASHFRAGAPKDEVLKAINPQIFFDKQLSHVHRAREKGIPSGHVPSVTREYDE